MTADRAEVPRSIEHARCVSSVGPGWYQIVRAVEVLLDGIAPGWTPGQVKEKFGELRFYVDPPDEVFTDGIAAERWGKIQDQVRAITDAATAASLKRCELCGRPGRHRQVGSFVLMTRCDGCAEKQL